MHGIWIIYQAKASIVFKTVLNNLAEQNPKARSIGKG
jgi:hypothetical protein